MQCNFCHETFIMDKDLRTIELQDIATGTNTQVQVCESCLRNRFNDFYNRIWNRAYALKMQRQFNKNSFLENKPV